ncbi:metallophosphoesterase [Oscillospiraceae bacterium WX1]
MKILVLSDSHGQLQPMLNAIFDEKPDLVLHLGDYERDAVGLRRAYPEIYCRAVRGNGDYHGHEPDIDEFVIDNKRIFMTHGHLYGVKMSLDSLVNTALCRGADVVLFGHTHRPLAATVQDMLVINPGSAGMGKKTGAVLEIEHGAVSCRMIDL